MLDNVSSNFIDIVIIGERIEFALKIGKIGQGPSAATNVKKIGFNSDKMKEGEGQIASTIMHRKIYPSTRYKPKHSHIANTPPVYHQNIPPFMLVFRTSSMPHRV